MSNIIKINAKFTDELTNNPITGKDFIVKVYDKDFITDDYLGEGQLGSEGNFELITDLENACSFETPLEFKPDVYFKLYHKDKEIFRSQVFKDVDFLKIDKITGRRNSKTQYFGNFKVSLDKVNSVNKLDKFKQEEFVLFGRVVDNKGKPLSDIIITIIDKDLIWDDLLAIGNTDKNGYFRFHFLPSEFRQDFFEIEKLPNIYCYFSIVDENSRCKVLKKEKFNELTFKMGEENLGNISLDNYYSQEISPNLRDIDPFYLSEKVRKRINLTQSIAENSLLEVIPIIEQKTKYRIKTGEVNLKIVNKTKEYSNYLDHLLSGLKDIHNYKLLNNLFTPPVKYIISKLFRNFTPAWFDPLSNTIYLNKKIIDYYNLDEFKVLLGHELIHYCQFTKTKKIKQLVDNSLELLINNILKKLENINVNNEDIIKILESSEFNKLMSLIEGYATYIQKEFLEDYYNCATEFKHKFDFISNLIVKVLLKQKDSKTTGNLTRTIWDVKLSQYSDGYETISNLDDKDFENIIKDIKQ